MSLVNPPPSRGTSAFSLRGDIYFKDSASSICSHRPTTWKWSVYSKKVKAKVKVKKKDFFSPLA
jgi:hypothetical protein